MASTTIHIQLETGKSGLTLELYPDGSDTAANSPADTVLEETNRLGLYTATVTEALEGIYYAKVMHSSSLRATGWVKMYDDTGTYHVIDDYLVAANLDASVSSTQDGARTVTVTVDDGSSALENATVRFTEGSNTFTASTDASGNATFNLDDATYTVAVTKDGYSFAGTTLAVSGDATPTYSMTQTTTPTASTPGFSTGYTYVYDEDGAVESGVVLTLYLVEAPSGSGLALDTATRTATSTGAGYAEFTNLIQGAKYRVYRSSSSNQLQFTCPAVSSFEINNFIGSD